MLRKNKGWIFLDRLSVGVGQVDINFEATLLNPSISQTQVLTIKLVIIPNNMWQKQIAFKCQNSDLQISKNQKEKIPQIFTILLDFSHKNQLAVKHSISFKVQQPITYHFVLKDCQKKFINKNFNRKSKLSVYLDIKNDGQQHGQDQQTYSFLLPLSLIATGIMLYYSKEKNEQIKIGAQNNTDLPKLILHFALWINFFALVFFYIGFLIYIYRGIQYKFFDFIYLLLHSLSQSIVTGLLIFVAFGWTITFLKTIDIDLYIPLGNQNYYIVGMLGLVNIILTLLTKINDGEHNKYHMHDSIPSYLLLGFKIITLLIFSTGIYLTYRCSKNNEQIVNFISKIGFVGFIYFLSLPVIVLGCTMINIQQRKWIVFVGQQLLKNLMNLWLTWMVSSKKSSYSHINKASNSFMAHNGKYL